MSVKVFDGTDELTNAAGTELGSTEWTVIDQSRINLFAQATGDYQWIHVDVERAKSGPFGGTIAHGFLTLSLLPVFLGELIKVDNVAMTINYGLGKVRFPSPVPTGSRVRGTSRIASVEALPGAAQVTYETVIEIEGVGKPACVIESIARYIA